MLRRDNLALTICLFLLMAAGLVGLSSCGGGGGGSRGPGDQTIITPPGNRAPVVVQALENVVLPPSSGRSRWESQPLGNFFSDPEGGTLEFSAQVDNSNVASVEISNIGTLVVQIQGSTTATITVTAQDSDHLSVEQKFTIAVSDMSLTPSPDHSDTPAAATDIFIGQTVEGHINSLEDVDYFRLRVAEPGTVTVTLDSELTGVQVSLLDDNGNVLAVAETESKAALLVTLGVGLYVIQVVLSPNELETAVVGRLPAPYNLIVQASLPPQFHPPRIRPGTLLGRCGCLTFIQPGGRKQEIHLADIIENPSNKGKDEFIFESFTRIQDGKDGLTYKFDHETSLLTIEPSTTADLGIHTFKVDVTGVNYYQRLIGNELVSVPAPVRKSLDFKVNVWATPRLLPEQSLDLVAQAGKRTKIDLREVIGPPKEVRHDPGIEYEIDIDAPLPLKQNVVLLQANIDPMNDFLSVEPPSELQGVISLPIRAWFVDVEGSTKEFMFQVIVGGPRIIPGSPPLSVSVSVGGSGEINLTHHIEDPLGGPLTFARKSVPSEFRLATSGSQWTIEAGQNVKLGEYDIMLSATDSNDLSEVFSLKVAVVACQAQVTFNEQGFFSPSRHFSTQFGTSSYSGACRNGHADGQGTYTASDTGRSLSYTGAWVDGEPRGLGDWHISDSNFGVLRYNGEWRNRQPNGQGTGIIEFRNGNDWRYTGAWVGGNPHGQGTWTAVTNGDRYRYVGEFRNGVQHGSGTETNAYANGDRERLVGEFRNDDLWNGTATWNGHSCRVVEGVYQC